MTDNNVDNRDKNFQENGKFAPGNTVSKNKKRDRTQTDKLLTALKKAGKRRNQNFWEVVAEKAFVNKEIMKAIIGKLVPNLQEISGKDGSPLSVTLKKVIYQDNENKDTQD